MTLGTVMAVAAPVRGPGSPRHADTRREIVSAAWDLAAERGLLGWTLKDVAEVVGMRAPSLYVYFAGKNDLYDAMFADGCTALLARGERISRDGAPVDVLRRVARVYVGFCVANPARYQLMFLRTVPGFTPSPSSYALALEILRLTREVLDAAGAGSQADLDLWTALVTGLATQQISNDPGGRRWRRLTDDAVTMYAAARCVR